jgi:hypothetical protein
VSRFFHEQDISQFAKRITRLPGRENPEGRFGTQPTKRVWRTNELADTRGLRLISCRWGVVLRFHANDSGFSGRSSYFDLAQQRHDLFRCTACLRSQPSSS